MGYIVNGKYHKGDGEPVLSEDAATYKQWHQGEQRKIHAREIVQPYKNGQPNPDFIAAFPEESKGYGFLPSDEQLRNL